MPSPYPTDNPVALETVTAEIVDAGGRPVPLSDVYLHHFFADIRCVRVKSGDAYVALYTSTKPSNKTDTHAHAHAGTC
jgi:hypothetical protein